MTPLPKSCYVTTRGNPKLQDVLLQEVILNYKMCCN